MFDEKTFLERNIWPERDYFDVIENLVIPVLKEYNLSIDPTSINSAIRSENGSIIKMNLKDDSNSNLSEGTITKNNDTIGLVLKKNVGTDIESNIILNIQPKARQIMFRMQSKSPDNHGNVASLISGVGSLSGDIRCYSFNMDSINFALSLNNSDFIKAIKDPNNAIRPDDEFVCDLPDLFEKAIKKETHITK